MKYTLCITRECNLACSYCYIGKSKAVMSLEVAQRAIEFVYASCPSGERIELAFFGGEPLLEFTLLQEITELIESHPGYDPSRVALAVVSNGVLFSEQVAAFINKHSIMCCLSCDGPPVVQDAFRRFPDGRRSSAVVERAIRRAIELLPMVLVNAVYHPQTIRHLPETVAYLASLGLIRIYINPDFSAKWTPSEAQRLTGIYRQLGDMYVRWYLEGTPRFVSLIDGKLAVIVRGGYLPSERCRMGRGEYAFAPDGRIYPCERLIGAGTDDHCIGHVNRGIDPDKLPCSRNADSAGNAECIACSLRNYCMNWCGCSNHFMTGCYDRVGPFLCASERAAIQVGVEVFQVLQERLGPAFIHEFVAMPSQHGDRLLQV